MTNSFAPPPRASAGSRPASAAGCCRGTSCASTARTGGSGSAATRARSASEPTAPASTATPAPSSSAASSPASCARSASSSRSAGRGRPRPSSPSRWNGRSRAAASAPSSAGGWWSAPATGSSPGCTCSACCDNRPVQRIARGLGGALVFHPGEAEAELRPPWPDPISALEEWLDEMTGAAPAGGGPRALRPGRWPPYARREAGRE